MHSQRGRQRAEVEPGRLPLYGAAHHRERGQHCFWAQAGGGRQAGAGGALRETDGVADAADDVGGAIIALSSLMGEE